MKLTENESLYYRGYEIIYDAHYYGSNIQIIGNDIVVAFSYTLMKVRDNFYAMADITNKIPGVSVNKDVWLFEDTIDLANVIDQLVDIVDHCKDLDLQMGNYIANAFASNTKSARSTH